MRRSWRQKPSDQSPTVVFGPSSFRASACGVGAGLAAAIGVGDVAGLALVPPRLLPTLSTEARLLWELRQLERWCKKRSTGVVGRESGVPSSLGLARAPSPAAASLRAGPPAVSLRASAIDCSASPAASRSAAPTRPWQHRRHRGQPREATIYAAPPRTVAASDKQATTMAALLLSCSWLIGATVEFMRKPSIPARRILPLTPHERQTLAAHRQAVSELSLREGRRRRSEETPQAPRAARSTL